MTPKQFDAATPQERNEAVARALGWKWLTNSNVVLAKPDGSYANYKEIPDWQGSDGLAFEELWPEIESTGALCQIGGTTLKSHVVQINNWDFNGSQIFQADTWAHAICQAFLALKGDPK